MKRIAIIGLGRWGQRLMRALSTCAEVPLCCNRSRPDRQSWLQQHYPSIRSTFDVDDVFGDHSIDAVAIATPPGTHADLARRALEAGKHVFVEKPLATSLKDSEALISLALQMNRRLFVGHIFFFHPVFERLSEILDTDPLVSAQMRWLKFGTFDEELAWNLLPHDIALARAFFGAMPDRVTILEQSEIRTAVDMINLGLDFSGARSCHIQIDRCSTQPGKMVRLKTLSGSVLTWDSNVLYRLDRSAGFVPVFEGTEEPLQREVRAFVQSMDNAAPDFLTGAIAVDVARIIESVRSGLRGHCE